MKKLAAFTGLILIMLVSILFICRPVTSKSISDPVAGWAFQTFDDFLPSSQRHHYHLDSAITDDYHNFIKTNNLNLMGAITGYYEDGNGQHAIEFVASPPKLNATWNYVLIYDKDNKRTKVIKYNYSGVYQS
jgi:hypothetical protein